MNELWMGLMIPFLGTSLGAACVFFMKGAMHDSVQKGLQGFAAGVMTAASFFSLLLPAIEQSEHLGRLSFLPESLRILLKCFSGLIVFYHYPERGGKKNVQISAFRRTS